MQQDGWKTEGGGGEGEETDRKIKSLRLIRRQLRMEERKMEDKMSTNLEDAGPQVSPGDQVKFLHIKKF